MKCEYHHVQVMKRGREKEKMYRKKTNKPTFEIRIWSNKVVDLASICSPISSETFAHVPHCCNSNQVIFLAIVPPHTRQRSLWFSMLQIQIDYCTEL